MNHLKFLRLKDFKTINSRSFPLTNLNVFLGKNAMGKSTTLQSLLLLRQSITQWTMVNEPLRLLLKGKLIELGTLQDILSKNSTNEEIEIEIGNDKGQKALLKIPYTEANRSADVVDLKAPEANAKRDNFLLFGGDFQYLSADRSAPKSIWEASFHEVTNNRNLGKNGEYTVHFLQQYGNSKDLKVDEHLLHPRQQSIDQLKTQVEAWMSELSSPFRIATEPLSDIDKVKLSYDFFREGGLTESFKPEHVGFGITYVLPVVTTLLAGNAKKVQIIENPESHLHPKGQATMGRLLARAASAGQQLFVETHSDHVINGIRVAVKKGLLKPDQVNIFFFDRDLDLEMKGSGLTEITHIEIDKNGGLSDYPEGFLDEWDKQLLNLI